MPMKLSNKNAKALLVDLNQDIEEYAEYSVRSILDDKNFEFLSYPPNSGFTDPEKAELGKLSNNEHLKNVLRKVIADSSAGVIFDMLNVFDGTGSPKYYYDEWSGVKLIDEEFQENEEEFNDMLHDRFYESYWEWRKIRSHKKWKLDIYDK